MEIYVRWNLKPEPERDEGLIGSLLWEIKKQKAKTEVPSITPFSRNIIVEKLQKTKIFSRGMNSMVVMKRYS